MTTLKTAVLGLGVIALVAGCGSGAEGSEASGAAPAGLLRSGELSVCTDPEYPPMEFFEAGDTTNPVGFTSDSAKALADLWDVDITWQVTSFDGLMPALQAKRCDILWTALYLSPERLEVANGTPSSRPAPASSSARAKAASRPKLICPVVPSRFRAAAATK